MRASKMNVLLDSDICIFGSGILRKQISALRREIDGVFLAKDIEHFTNKVDHDGFGLSKSHIYRIANGYYTPSLFTIILLCEALTLMLDRNVKLEEIVNVRNIQQIKAQTNANPQSV